MLKRNAVPKFPMANFSEHAANAKQSKEHQVISVHHKPGCASSRCQMGSFKTCMYNMYSIYVCFFVLVDLATRVTLLWVCKKYSLMIKIIRSLLRSSKHNQESPCWCSAWLSSMFHLHPLSLLQDCDMYSSAKEVLFGLAHLLGPGEG